MSHLAAWDVRAHLNRIFGFAGWSADLLALENLYDVETTTRAGKAAHKVAYRATLRLTINDPDQPAAVLATYTEAAVGESVMPDFKRGDCHDMAIKTAESQALKRCAVNLGDQFGLSLYANGTRNAVVRGSVAYEGTTVSPGNTNTEPAEQVTPDPEQVPSEEG
jgi:recombination DNA repair RAD52 pathway protein